MVLAAAWPGICRGHRAVPPRRLLSRDLPELQSLGSLSYGILLPPAQPTMLTVLGRARIPAGIPAFGMVDGEGRVLDLARDS